MKGATVETKKLLTPALAKAAAGLAVREAEETAPGTWQAFVDDGPDSFDVVVTMSGKDAVAGHSCDCGKGSKFCVHRAALLLHLSQPAGKPKAAALPARKKERPLETLVRQVEEAALRQWLIDTLEKHKDLALAFTTRFGAPATVTAKAVTQGSEEALKTVAGRQRAMDATQLRKLLLLWQDIHEAPLKWYLEHPSDPDRFAPLNAVFIAIGQLRERFQITSKKLGDYAASLTDRLCAGIAEIGTEAAYHTAVGAFLQQLTNEQYYIVPYYLALLERLAEAASPARRAQLAELFAALYRKHLAARSINTDALTRFALPFYETCGVLNEYLEEIPSLPWTPAHNERLLSALVQAGRTGRAEEIAKKEITNNRNDLYNDLYLRTLRAIYAARGDEKALVGVLQQLLLLQPNLEDYRYVMERIDDNTQKSLRNRLFSRARSSRDPVFRLFEFQVLAAEGKWKKLLEALRRDNPVTVVLPWFEELRAHLASEFFTSMLSWPESWSSYQQDPELRAREEEELLTRVLAAFPPQLITVAVKTYKPSKYVRPSRLQELLAGVK